MKEENDQLKKLLSTNPFGVPGNYFENLTKEVMERLPEKEPVPVRGKRPVAWMNLRPWVYMAAMLVVVLLPLRYWSARPSGNDSVAETMDLTLVSDEYLETVMDHSMMDDYTMYRYLTDADIDY